MVIHWGPQRVVQYNDAFAVLLGGKHPAAHGRPAEDESCADTRATGSGV